MVKILIIDCSSLMRKVLGNIVSEEGHQFLDTSDVKEALKKYKTEKPALVFMELLLPTLDDGKNLLREIRKFDSSSKIVIVTSLKDKKEFEQVKDIGARGYLNKPFSRHDIVSAINELKGTK